jgi:hypothetical protein
LHLVFVHERVPEQLPALEETRGRVLYAFLAERRARALDDGLRRLREHYDVRIQWPLSLESASLGGSS